MPTPQLPFHFEFEPAFSFANFVAEPGNHPLLHRLQADAGQPGQLTWLWGQQGIGKTHLLQAFCQRHKAAIYVPVARLQQHAVESLHSLMQCDLLVLDDLHLLAGYPAWEEALFELCNGLLARQGTLLASSQLPPGQTPFALQDLRSRLQLALVYEVKELSDAGKGAVLQTNATARGIELREDVVHFLLSRHSRSLQELLLVLAQLDKQALAEQRRLTIPFIKSVMGW